jgi:pimeloyl-ACP methyl ester carboxylesterase
MNRWHKECPESQLVIIENAHHVANQDNPEETNRVIISFLDEVLT